MKLTPKLKAWLEKEAGVAVGSEDSVYLEAAAKAVISGTLTADLQKALTVDEDAAKATKLETMLEKMLNRLEATDAAIAELKAKPEQPVVVEEKGGGLKESVPEMPAAVKAAINETGEKAPGAGIRVKGAHERYDNTKTAAVYPATSRQGAKHAMAGMPVSIDGGYPGAPTRTIHAPNQLDQAISGVWFKFAAMSSMGRDPFRSFTEHEKDMFDFILNECEFGGAIGGQGMDVGAKACFKEPTRLSEQFRKNVVDDAVSGGLEAAPIVFDDSIITFPLLHGELFPRVKVINIDRGRRIEGVTVQNVTMTWGGGDSQPNDLSTNNIALFDTDSFIAAFDTLIRTVDGAIRLGKDFLSDSPIAIGTEVQRAYGEKFLEELDRVIAVGASGSGEPVGVMNAAGTTSVTTTNNTTGPPTVGDYEALLFGVPKQYRTAFGSAASCFVANEVSYQRARGIPVGGSDERRVFGMNEEDYMLLGHPYAIHHGMTNVQGFFFVGPRYRMYRRLGLVIDVEDRGETLKRANNILITARARFGGQLEDGAAASVSTTFQNA